jgi:capsular exopolysaccharide synthesis family protein
MPEFSRDLLTPHSESITIREVLGVVENHKWLIAAVVSVFLSAVAVLIYLEPRVYRAEAVIRLKEVTPILVGDREVPELALSRATDPLLSRLEVLRSRTLIGSIVDSLGLRLIAVGGDPLTAEVSGMKVSADAAQDTLTVVFDPGGIVVSGATGTTRAAYGDTIRHEGIEFSLAERPEITELIVAVLPRELAIDRVLANLQVLRREGTDVVDVSYQSPNPYIAQSLANAVVVMFQAQGVEAAREQSRVRREFLGEQLAQMESILNSSQSNLTRFRSNQNLAGTAERISAEQTELLSLETRLSELRADRRLVAGLAGNLRTDNEASRAAAVRAVAALPQLASQPAIVGNYEQIMRYQTVLDSLTTGPFRVAPTNPDVVQLATLIRTTEDRIADALDSYVTSADARIAALESLRSRTASSVQSLPGKEAEDSRLSRQVEVTTEMANELRLEYQQARIAENVQIGDVDIVDMAALPYKPVFGMWPIKLIIGLLLGLGTGITLAFIREARNTSFRRPEELGEVLHLPQLAVIPRTPELSLHGSRKVAGFLPKLPSRSDAEAVDEDPPEYIERLGTTDLVSREAFRMLRTSVLSSVGDEHLRSVAVTSVGPGEGKTLTAVNLAISFAHKGMNIVLVDCDVRRPRVHKVLDTPRAPGLADLLDPRSSYFLRVQRVLKKTPLMNLSVIPCGTPPSDPLDLFEGAPIRRLIADLVDRFDLVIFDTPPVLAAADTAILGQLVDGAVLVIRAGQTDRDAAQRAYAQLSLAKVRVLGAIFNDPDGKKRKNGQRYGPYKYAATAEYMDA